ncbi:MAG: hypothetical protein ACREB5_04800 [Sphingomonadaceae bacterium]
MRSSPRPIAVAALLATALTAGAAAAQTPRDVSDLVGARASSGETQLEARGYRFSHTTTGDDRKWSFWWNPARKQCLSVATVEGRYDSIITTPAPDCRQADAGASAYGGDGLDRGRTGNAVGGRAVDLGLMCFGEGERPTAATRYGWQWNERSDRYEFGNRTELTTQQFDSSLMIQLRDGGGRIRLPKKLVPPIHSGGSDGWWPLYEIVIQPDQIRGSYRLNGLNKPRVTIDRRSGRITVQGTASYAFRGSCDPIDGDDHRRF